MRRILVVLVMLVSAFGTLAQETEVEPWVCPEGFAGETLNVYNWSTYIAENTVPDFEAACDVTVVYDIYDSDDTMVTRIRQGNPGYDIIFPGSFLVPVMVNEGLLVPIDLEKIPNFANIAEVYQERVYDPGNQYTIPYLLFTVGVGYNTEVFPDGITSWEQVWDFDGSVAWVDDTRRMMGIALLMLGYDANSTDPEEVEAAGQYLLERSGNVVTVAADDGQELLARGEVDIAIEYSGDILSLAYECECDTFAYTIPEEGSNFELDAVAIPVDAPHPELAMVFMDYLLHPQTAADIANYTAYGSPNQAAIDAGLIDEEYLNDPAIYPSEEVVAKSFIVTNIDADGENLYNEVWEELLINMSSQ